MCIIKGDIICKGLSFSIIKDLTVRQQKIMEKYKNLCCSDRQATK